MGLYAYIYVLYFFSVPAKGARGLFSRVAASRRQWPVPGPGDLGWIRSWVQVPPGGWSRGLPLVGAGACASVW